MDIKEYLEQGFLLDKKINHKLEQLSQLNDLALKCTPVYSHAPKAPNRDSSRIENIVIKIVDLQNEINCDIDRFVDLKREIVHLIKAVDDEECKMVLELRYINHKKWEEIALEMNYTIRWTYRVHKKALKMVEDIRKNKSVH